MISFFMHFNNKIIKKKGNRRFFTNIYNEGGKIVMKEDFIVVGKFDCSKYRLDFKCNTTDVILTKNRFFHIVENHPEVSKYFKKIKMILKNPDEVYIENNKVNTLWIVKELEDNIKITLKINTIEDINKDYKHSIIQMQLLDKQRIKKYMNNLRISKVFAKEKVM